jgi:hypothetical protein
MEHTSHFTKNYGEFMLKSYMGESNNYIMPSNEKTDGRDKKRHVYKGKSQEGCREL